MIQDSIKKLTAYGFHTGLIGEEDIIYTVNRLLELFDMDELEYDVNVIKNTGCAAEELEGVLSDMMDYAYEQGIMKENSVGYRDLFDTKIMSILVPRPEGSDQKV